MSWSSVIANGSGSVAFRLMIPGHPYEAVSDPALAGASSDGRVRIAGLNVHTVGWSEDLDPVQCRLSARGFTAEIVEDEGTTRWGDSFVKAPTKVNYLSASVDDNDVAIPLIATNTVNAEVYYLGQECLLVTANGGTATPTFERGYRDTLAQYHYVDPTAGLSRPEVTSSRPSIEGSVAFLYAYGNGETGVGTLVWRGVVATQPRLRSLHTWEIQLDSVMGVFDQSLSADLQDPVTLRGISYNAATIPNLRIKRLNSALSTGIPAEAAVVSIPQGFYETQDAFCAAVNSAITTATAGWSAGNKLNVSGGAAPTLVAAPTASGSWGLTFTPGATPYWHSVQGAGLIDPTFINLDDTTVDTVVASTPYTIGSTLPLDGAGTVPRGSIGGPRSATVDYAYLGGAATLTTADSVTIRWPEFNGMTEQSHDYAVTAWDASARKGTLSLRTRPERRLYTRDSTPEITVSRSYVTSGDLSDFVYALVDGAAENANAGRQPYITDNHVDTATIAANVQAAVAGRAWAAERIYSGSSDVKLGELIAEEMKLIGVVPSIGNDGRFVVVPFRVGAGTESTSYTVNATTHLSSVQLPGFEPSAKGLLNTIKILTGFDPSDGKHTGDTFIVRDAAALSRNPLPSTMKIEPRSSAADGDRRIPIADVVALAQSWFGVLGAAYTVITVVCPLGAINCTVGSQVSVTIDQIPDTENGGRGVSLIGGMVIRRDVKPAQGTVELGILTSQVRIAGYTPSSLVDSVTAGATRVVTLEAVQPTGYATAASWTVGDAVELVQYDQATSTSITATVTAVDTGAGTVTIGSIGGGAATPSGVLTLEYGGASTATAHQQAYCFVADTDDQIAFGTPRPARQLAS